MATLKYKTRSEKHNKAAVKTVKIFPFHEEIKTINHTSIQKSYSKLFEQKEIQFKHKSSPKIKEIQDWKILEIFFFIESLISKQKL